jgi:hypothetical protein
VEPDRSFGWALDKMRDGYAVRRPFWDGPGGWTYDAEAGTIRGQLGQRLALIDAEDVLATDWHLAP